MAFGGGAFVLLPKLDGLVSLACDQPAAGLVKGARKNASLTLDGPWLHDCLALLEAVAGGPVPEPACEPARFTEQHADL